MDPGDSGALPKAEKPTAEPFEHKATFDSFQRTVFRRVCSCPYRESGFILF